MSNMTYALLCTGGCLLVASALVIGCFAIGLCPGWLFGGIFVALLTYHGGRDIILAVRSKGPPRHDRL